MISRERKEKFYYKDIGEDGYRLGNFNTKIRIKFCGITIYKSEYDTKNNSKYKFKNEEKKRVIGFGENISKKS